MMKNISKLAALAVATAFLLAGFPACSGDDDDGGNGGVPTTDTVSPASFELTSCAEAVTQDFTLTLVTTQINEAGLAELKANADLTEQKADIVTQSEGDHITVSALKVAEDATATTLKLSVTMASNATAGTTGTLTLTLPAKFTANGEAIAQTVKYTITDGTTTPPNPDEGDPATPTAKPFVWDASDWFEAYPKDSPALTEDKKFGELTIGAKNKVTNDGTFDITVGEETVTVTGYFQLNNSSKGTVTFYAPKDTTKISIWAKLDASTKQLKFSAGETELHTFTGEASTNYKEYSFEPSFTADTIVTITNPGTSSANCKYLVVAAPTSPETIPVTKITIAAAETVRVGGRIALTATVEPENATKQTVDWSLAEGETKATISGGKLLGVGAGTVTVTASAKDESGVKETKDITITAAATASVTNEALGLTAAEVSGSDTVATGAKTDTGVTFTAVAPGEATATVKDASGNAATVTVTVAEDGTVTAEVKEAYVSGQSKISYFTESTDSVTATVAGDLISGSNVEFGFDVEGFSVDSVSANTAQVDKKDFPGIIVTCTSTIVGSATVEQGKTVGWAKFTVTAQKACKITKIMATTGQSQSGNLGTAIYVGDASAPVNKPAGAKVSSAEIELEEPVVLEANATKEIKVAIYAAKAWSKTDEGKTIKCDMYFMNFAVTAEAAQ